MCDCMAGMSHMHQTDGRMHAPGRWRACGTAPAEPPATCPPSYPRSQPLPSRAAAGSWGRRWSLQSAGAARRRRPPAASPRPCAGRASGTWTSCVGGECSARGYVGDWVRDSHRECCAGCHYAQRRCMLSYQWTLVYDCGMHARAESTGCTLNRVRADLPELACTGLGLSQLCFSR